MTPTVLPSTFAKPRSSRVAALSIVRYTLARSGKSTGATSRCSATSAETKPRRGPCGNVTLFVSTCASINTRASSGAAPKPNAINSRSPGNEALIGAAEESGGRDVVLAAHGWFNRMLRPQLKKRGWANVHDGGDKYWSFRIYQKR